jgi:hypothetical protein
MDFREGSRDPFKKAREAPGTVAAHFRFPAIAVEISHPKIGCARGVLHQKYAIRSHTSMAIAQKRYLLRRKFISAAPIVDKDEIVAGTVHFRELKHIRSLTYAQLRRKHRTFLISSSY